MRKAAAMALLTISLTSNCVAGSSPPEKTSPNPRIEARRTELSVQFDLEADLVVVSPRGRRIVFQDAEPIINETDMSSVEIETEDAIDEERAGPRATQLHVLEPEMGIWRLCVTARE